MPRPTRVCIPGQWHHIRHRALPEVNLLRHDGDAHEWRTWLADTSAQFRVQLHAFTLLPGEIRWVGTPKDPLSIAGMMKELARRAARRRGETLWAGRYGSALIEESECGLSVLASIDLAAHQAGLVTDWLDWPHASAAAYAGRAELRFVTPPSVVWAMGNTPFERERVYAQTVPPHFSADFDRRLLEATDRQWAIGSATWLAQMESIAGRGLKAGRRGRPKRSI